MKKIVGMFILVMFLIGCAGKTEHPSFNDKEFVSWNAKLIDAINNNPDYKKIPLKTQEQSDDFFDLSYKAFKKEISKDEFIRVMEIKYPHSSESIRWIASQYPN